MSRLLIDTSVIIKWFHDEGESELEPSRALLEAHLRGDLHLHVIDLAFYEVGNVLARALRWRGADVADQLDDLAEVVGDPLPLTRAASRDAATLAEEFELSYYDASWAAVARELDVALVSADKRLLASGLADSPTATAARLRLGGSGGRKP